jgi:outer membrane protein assembly factor BamB
MVHALDAETGRERWTYTAGGRIDSSTVIAGKRAFLATTGGEVLGLDLASGQKVWSWESGSAFTASPAVARGRLVISSLDGMVYCFGEGPPSSGPTPATKKKEEDA